MKIDRLYIFIKWPKLLSIVTQGQKVANHNTTQEHKCIYGMASHYTFHNSPIWNRYETQNKKLRKQYI